jgi:hypothetical protein
VKNFTVLYSKVLEEFKEGSKNGFWVYDAYLKKTVQKFITVSHNIEDTRGLKNPLNCKSAPAMIGGCPFCVIEGCRVHKTTVYVGAITHVPRTREGDNLRKRFREEYKEFAAVADRWNTKKHKAITTTYAMASGARVESKESTSEEEPYKGKDALTNTFGPEYDKVARTGADLAHGFANLVKDMIGLISNDGKMKLKPARLHEEQKIGRFQGMSTYIICFSKSHTYHTKTRNIPCKSRHITPNREIYHAKRPFFRKPPFFLGGLAPG